MATGCKWIFDKARDEHVAQLVRGESVRGPQDQPPHSGALGVAGGWEELREKLRVAIADRDEAERLQEWGTYQHCSGLVVAYQNAFAVLARAHPNSPDEPTRGASGKLNTK